MEAQGTLRTISPVNEFSNTNSEALVETATSGEALDVFENSMTLFGCLQYG